MIVLAVRLGVLAGLLAGVYLGSRVALVVFLAMEAITLELLAFHLRRRYRAEELATRFVETLRSRGRA